jgi:hypothetical protein
VWDYDSQVYGFHAKEVELMEILMRARKGKTLDEMLSPEDKLIYRCTDCGEFFLPREVHILKRRVHDDLNGMWTWESIELCPACVVSLADEARMVVQQSSPFITLKREAYDVTRAYERAGLLPPEVRMDGSILAN